MKRGSSPEHKRKDQLRRLALLGQFPTRIKHARLHGRLDDANDFGNLFDRLAVVVSEVDDLAVLRRQPRQGPA